MKKTCIPVIVGATASGKTAVGVEFSKILGGEVISADSMQIYKYMTIGTAKPTPEETDGIPHHLIDCVDPGESYSVARYKEEAYSEIESVLGRGSLPVVVGGTGLYINALTLPWSFNGPSGSTEIRARLEKEYDNLGAQALWNRLDAVDSVSAKKIHPNNKKRIVRALEIYESTGRTKSEWDAEAARVELPYDYVMMGIAMDRALLYSRIERRIDKMIDEGLEEEVASLLERGYDPSLTSMQALGYKEMIPAVEGKRSLEECKAVLKRDTRHFAKRQLTWFRRDQRIKWFMADQNTKAEALARQMADYYIEKTKE